MAKMKMAPHDRPKVKAECLRMLATLRLDPARSRLIGVFIDSYLSLTAQEMAKFEREVSKWSPAEKEATMELMTSWERRGLEKGIAEGEARGALREAQNMLLLVGEGRLGPPDQKTAEHIRAIAQVSDVESLAKRVLAVESWADLLS